MAIDSVSKVRRKKHLEHKSARRNSADRILIVTEGEKTEPNYFKGLLKYHRLHTVTVVPCGSGTEPEKIVDYAVSLFRKGKGRISKGAFEKVYIVFDKDVHQSYQSALDKVSSLKRKYRNDEGNYAEFIAIPSVPDFELWFLLHFEEVDFFSDRSDILKKLKKHLKNYSKSDENMYSALLGFREAALKRAGELRRRGYSADSGETQPYTDADRLAKVLISLKDG